MKAVAWGPILDVPLLEMARGQPCPRTRMGIHAPPTAFFHISISMEDCCD